MSYIAIPAVTDPPGELMYKKISFSGSSAAKNNNCATTEFAKSSLITPPINTKTEAENMIREGLKPYINEVPIVTVRMANYKISVLGEVARPGTFTVSNEKVNIFEALALAGDMTVWGVRNDVKLIREDADGQRMVMSLNLNDANIINSDYYYLQQNDVVYVTPNKVKARNSDIGSATSLWFTAGSMLVSIASLLVNILK